MRSADDNAQTSEFDTIRTLATLLEVQVVSYTEKHFPVKQFPEVEKLTPENLIVALETINARPEAVTSLAEKGIISSATETVATWGVRVASGVKIAKSPIEYHRLPQLLYFAEKARELKSLLSKIIGYSQVNGLSFSDNEAILLHRTGVGLIAALQELFSTITQLTQSTYSTLIKVSVNNQSREIAGMKGGWGSSELANNLTQQILDKYQARFDNIKRGVSEKVGEIVEAKTMEKNATIKLALSVASRKNDPVAHHISRQPSFFSPVATSPFSEKVEARSVKRSAQLSPKIDVEGFSPLYLALMDVNAPYQLRSDLDLNQVEALLKKGADPNESLEPVCCCSYLHIALFHRTESKRYPYELRGKKKMNLDLIQLLLEHGARVDVTPSDEPVYNGAIIAPNIPGIITDKQNNTPAAKLLRQYALQQDGAVSAQGNLPQVLSIAF